MPSSFTAASFESPSDFPPLTSDTPSPSVSIARGEFPPIHHSPLVRETTTAGSTVTPSPAPSTPAVTTPSTQSTPSWTAASGMLGMHPSPGYVSSAKASAPSDAPQPTPVTIVSPPSEVQTPDGVVPTEKSLEELQLAPLPPSIDGMPASSPSARPRPLAGSESAPAVPSVAGLPAGSVRESPTVNFTPRME